MITTLNKHINKSKDMSHYTYVNITTSKGSLYCEPQIQDFYTHANLTTSKGIYIDKNLK